jgi:DNA-binding response OmpR family regulator
MTKLKAKLLIVEDDKRLSDMLCQELGYEGHDVVAVHKGAEALLRATSETFDLIVLDLNLPDMDGLEVAERLHGSISSSILMLTARADLASRVAGLYAGASDYMTKPFSLQELLARIFVRLRERNPNNGRLAYKELELDSNSRQCIVKDEVLMLTANEYALLELLLKNQGRIFSKEDIEERLYRNHDGPGSTTIEVFVSSLRKKLAQAGAEGVISTVRGMGYVIQ